MERVACSSDYGILCLWNEKAFENVTDFEDWERELLFDSDICRHIEAGHFVPLSVGNPSVMTIEIRRGKKSQPAALKEREERYLMLASGPYRLRSDGVIGVSGIDEIEVPPLMHVRMIDLPAGEYAVRVHWIVWYEEPGMSTDDGCAPGALADIVVLIDPAKGDETFRTELETYGGLS